MRRSWHTRHMRERVAAWRSGDLLLEPATTPKHAAGAPDARLQVGALCTEALEAAEAAAERAAAAATAKAAAAEELRKDVLKVLRLVRGPLALHTCCLLPFSTGHTHHRIHRQTQRNPLIFGSSPIEKTSKVSQHVAHKQLRHVELAQRGPLASSASTSI